MGTMTNRIDDLERELRREKTRRDRAESDLARAAEVRADERCPTCGAGDTVPLDPASGQCLWCLAKALRAEVERLRADRDAALQALRESGDVGDEALCWCGEYCYLMPPENRTPQCEQWRALLGEEWE